MCTRGGNRKKDIQALKEACQFESIQAYSIYKKRTVFNWLIALLNFPTFNAFRVYSLELETMVKWSMNSADLVIVDHIEMIDVIPERFKGKVIYHSHNAEFKIWNDYADLNSSIFTSWAMKLEASRVKRLERYAIRSTSFTFAAPNDQEVLCNVLGVEPDKFRLTYHLGNDALLELPGIEHQENTQLFYAGTLDWEPNRDGLQWFLKECWPSLKQKHPNLSLKVCGKGASQELSALMDRCNGVEHLGFVEDLEQVMSQSAMAIIPLRFGSGMKIKTLDAMYRGLPFVSTSVGAEGIAIEDGIHGRIADDVQGFSGAISEMLEDPELRSKMSALSRELAKEKYTYSSLGKSMIADINKALE